MAKLASDGHLNLLQLAHTQGGAWDSSACEAALKGGHVDCLQYLHVHGCPWGTVKANSVSGTEKCYASMKYACEHGCALDLSEEHLVSLSKDISRLPVLKYTCEHGGECTERVLSAAVFVVNVSAAAYLLEQHCPAGPDALLTALDHPQCLNLLLEHGVKGDGRAMDAALARGNAAQLQLLHEHGCPWGKIRANMERFYPWSEAAITFAYEHGCGVSKDPNWMVGMAQEGKLDAMKLAYTHGAPWDARTCTAAAKAGHLDCLKYAHERGCRWDEETVLAALRAESFECLQYACHQGCPVGEEAFALARDPAAVTPSYMFLLRLYNQKSAVL